jgi:hypothetical protein
VAWYKAEGNANATLHIYNGTAIGATYGPGEVGQAFQFNGGGYVRAPDLQVPPFPTLDTPAVTVEGWVKSSTVSTYKYIVSKGADSSLAASYGLYTGGNGGLVFYIFSGSDLAFSPSAGPGIWDGKWHHVAGTDDGSFVRLYVDGKQFGNGTPSNLKIDYNLPDGSDLIIGSYLGPGTWGFTGSVDELTVYDRALSPGKIQAIYAAGTAGKTAGTVNTTAGVEVDLQTGTATGLAGGVSHIQSLVGSPGDDILVGDGGNLINGGGGRDVLIAGPSASIPQGTDADILIGGQTAADRDMAALEAVLASWADPTASLASRVTRLLTGALAPGKVSSNRQHNILLGGGGPNLFLASAGDTTNKSTGDASFTIQPPS